MRSKFGGTGVALATPMHEDLSVDFASLEKLIEYTIEGGVDYLVAMGTTGESSSFDWREKLEVLAFVLEKNNGRVPIVFGHGGNNTQDLINKSKELSNFGIDAILSVSPYYNRPSQKGIVRHFQLLADQFPKPIILYNVPARTASNVIAETTLELSAHDNIIAMKEASGDIKQCKEIIENKDSDFQVLCGDDQLTHEMIKDGADGVISVIANIFPKPFSSMVTAALLSDAVSALKLNNHLLKAYELLSQEGNPTSLKTGLGIRGICGDTVRPPLYEGSDLLKNEWRDLLSSSDFQ